MARGPARPPLSFQQQRLWLLHQLEPGLTAYNLPNNWAQARRLVGRLAARIRRLGPPPADADAAVLALGRAQRAAARAYVARAYPAPVSVFMSQRRHTQHYVDPQFGWGGVVTGRLDVKLVPLSEGTVIQHPDGARAVAAELEERIRQAQLAC